MPRKEERSSKCFRLRKKTKGRGRGGGRKATKEVLDVSLPAGANFGENISSSAFNESAGPSFSGSSQHLESRSLLFESYLSLEKQPAFVRKSSYFNESIVNSDFSDLGYRIVSFNGIRDLIEALACPDCGKRQLQLQEKQKGMMTVFETFCCFCRKTASKASMSKYNELNKTSDINLLAVTSAKNNGIGYSKLCTFISGLNIPKPMHLKSYQMISRCVDKAVSTALEEHFNKAASIIKSAHNSIESGSDGGIINIAVSFDGSWHKRGHSSLFGVGAVVDLLTGLCIDIAVISKYCHGCSMARSNSTKYKNHHCQINYMGSSGGMEVEAALLLFGRSVEKYGLRYLTVLSDGDSKAYLKLKETNVYGEEYEILKEECINHVSKRMGSALRKLKDRMKLDGKSIGGKGKLTNEKIEKIQNYYGKALKDNAPDTVKMKNAAFASLFHMISTDTEPHHKFCPLGRDSWCHYNRALVDPALSRPHKPTIPKDIGEILVPVYKRLTDPELLQRCTRKKTQNCNESLHSIIWQKCPKTAFASLNAVTTAASLAVLQFNKGPTMIFDVLRCLNIYSGKHQMIATSQSVKRKLQDSVRFSSGEAKEDRKAKKLKNLRKCDQEDAYEAGAF